MPFVETDLWMMEIPEEWTASQEDDMVCIADPDEIGSLDVSAVCKEQGDVTEADINAFAEDLIAEGQQAKAVEVGDLQGLFFEYQTEDTHCREWFLTSAEKKDLLIFATYTCEPEQAGMDDVVIDQMLDSLVPLSASASS